MTRLFRIVTLLLIAIVLFGCTSFGAGTINNDKEDFTDSISNSIKTQILRNIVRLRYGDMPFFLDVKSVIKSYSMEYRLNAGADIYPEFKPDAGVSGTYADKPTISYAPLVGDDFADNIMKPITPTFLIQLLQSGARAESLFRLFSEEINGLANRQIRGDHIRLAEDDFDRVIELLQSNQDSGNMDLQVRAKEDDLQLIITQT